jgi:opacity protein-like surface antigen
MRLALLLLCAAASPALADDNEVSIGFTGRSLRSNSANAVSDDNLAGGELTYARGVPVELPGDVGIQLIGGFNWNSVSGTMFNTMQTDVGSTGFSVGLRARYAIHKRVVANARADLGMNHTSLDLEMNGRTLSDAKWHAVTRGSLGVDVYAAQTNRVSVGARFEFGYVLATEAELAPREDTSDGETIMLPETQASIGGLDLGGRYFSVSFVLGF